MGWYWVATVAPQTRGSVSEEEFAFQSINPVPSVGWCPSANEKYAPNNNPRGQNTKPEDWD